MTADVSGRSGSPVGRLAADPTGGRPVVPSSGMLRPLGLGEVRITGGFWAQRQDINARATIPHIEAWLERAGWLGNFDLAAAGTLPAGRQGREFSDSEVYKFLEAVAWELGRRPDADLERRYEAVVRRVAAAQEPDGYLHTAYGRPGQPPRYSDLEWGHELYCFGHLIQAAVARARTRGPDLLVDVACRVADHVCEVFGEDGIASVCGHPEIEPALVELYRVTGERRYLEQARLFLSRRGHGVLADIEFGRAYYQDDVPLREATVLRGHAVRATYLASGAVDLAVETGDDDLRAAVRRQQDAAIARRTYITGGIGSRHQDEAFGDDFMLPPDRAYSETCAGVGSVMLSWRLLLADGDPSRADLIERTLYNVVATSPSAQGTAFYYTNTLHQRELGSVPDEGAPSPRASSSLRAPWFHVSCCPTNVARTFASLAAYVATTDDDGLQVHQYATSQIRTALPDGRRVAVDVTTDYPAEGDVVVRVVGGPDDAATWTLSLRVPSWARGATVEVAGEARPAEPGYIRIRRRFAPGDVVRLHLPVAPRFTWPHPQIDAVRGCVAVERGPEVLCVESVDVPEVSHVDELRVDTSVPPRDDGDGVVVRAVALDLGRAAGVPADGALPYYDRPAEPARTRALDVRLTPYHDWANRGPSTMRVWLPTA